MNEHTIILIGYVEKKRKQCQKLLDQIYLKNIYWIDKIPRLMFHVNKTATADLALDR